MENFFFLLRNQNCFNMPPLLPAPLYTQPARCLAAPVLQPSAPPHRVETDEAELQLSKQVFNMLAGSSSQQPHRQTRAHTCRLAQ